MFLSCFFQPGPLVSTKEIPEAKEIPLCLPVSHTPLECRPPPSPETHSFYVQALPRICVPRPWLHP